MNKIRSFTPVKCLPVIVIAVLVTLQGKTQFLSLNKTEITKLRVMVATDPGAKQQYASMKTLADAALTETPNPIDTIVSEGHLATDPKKIITQKSLADMNKMYALSIVYCVTGNRIYREKCISFITAWAKMNHGTGNPINDTKLDPLLEAYDLVKEETPEENKRTIEAWMRQVADAEINHPRFRSANRSAANNWNSHRIKVVGNIAFILEDKNYIKFTDTALQTQVARNLYPDGSGMDFEERDALHYHTYTLEPLLKIAAVIKRATGVDYYTYVSPTGSSIQKSVQFLVPFANGEKVHHEFVNSKTLFDRQRAENKEPGYAIGADWKTQNAIEALSEAAYFDPLYKALVKKLAVSQTGYPNWQSVLNAARN